MSTTKAITKSCIGSIKFIGGLLCLLWLLTACTSGAEQGSESPPMKFPVAGGDALLRAIDADSIRATYTWRLIDQPLGTEPVMMTRVGDTNQWQTPQITIPLNTGFIFQISWTAPDIEGYRIQYALQSFRSADGIDSDQVIDISEQNPRFDTFDDDADGVNNYQELLAGTPATVLRRECYRREC